LKRKLKQTASWSNRACKISLPRVLRWLIACLTLQPWRSRVVCSSETSITLQITRHYNPEDLTLRSEGREKFGEIYSNAYMHISKALMISSDSGACSACWML
jgi:hypothetical protein